MSYYDCHVSQIPIGDLTIFDAAAKSQKVERDCRLGVRDNGLDGDGIIADITAGEADRQVACFAIPIDSLPLIIESLSAIHRLRSALKPTLPA